MKNSLVHRYHNKIIIFSPPELTSFCVAWVRNYDNGVNCETILAEIIAYGSLVVYVLYPGVQFLNKHTIKVGPYVYDRMAYGLITENLITFLSQKG